MLLFDCVIITDSLPKTASNKKTPGDTPEFFLFYGLIDTKFRIVKE